MAFTTTQSGQSTATSYMMTTSSSHGTSQSPDDDSSEEYHTVLLVIYSMVLVIGTISLSLMMHIMKSSTTSITSIAVLNLIFTHFVFLLTVPFRIYYYATSGWLLGYGWCKVVSGMIHIHMYMSFIFYVIILITRMLTFYHRNHRVASFFAISATNRRQQSPPLRFICEMSIYTRLIWAPTPPSLPCEFTHTHTHACAHTDISWQLITFYSLATAWGGNTHSSTLYSKTRSREDNMVENLSRWFQFWLLC